MEALPSLPPKTPVLVAAGDKVLAPSVPVRLLRFFAETGADLLLAVGDRNLFPEAGILLRTPDGRPRRILEVPDLRFERFLFAAWEAARGTAALPADRLSRIAARFERRPAKRRIWIERYRRIEEAAGNDPLRLGKLVREATPSARDPRVERATEANLSVYVFRAAALRRVVGELAPANAQGEFYLTDSVEHLAATGANVQTFFVDSPDGVMAFNTPEELRAVRTAVRRRRSRSFRIAAADAPEPALRPEAWMRRLEQAPPADQSAAADALRLHADRFGAGRRVAIVRSPGRVNLMGRHIDHQGGIVNPAAVDRAAWLVFRPRNDGRIRLHHVDSRRHAAMDVRLDESVIPLGPGTWREAVDSPALPPAAQDPRESWHRYLLGAFARIRTAFPDRELRGFDGAISSDLPQGYGVSSSSSLTIAATLALVLTNGIECPKRDLVRLAGEAEWYAGTRGGFADQAAILLARPGRILSVFENGRSAGSSPPMPQDTELLLILSETPAVKSAGARAAFNSRVAAYGLACAWLEADGARSRKRRPRRLADFLPENEPEATADLLERLARMPAVVSDAFLRRMEPLVPHRFRRPIATIRAAREFSSLPLRGVALFGFSEMVRSARFRELIASGRIETAGRLMFRSHDGDRVSRWRGGRRRPWTPSIRPSDLLRAADRCRRSSDPAGVLARMTGAYACSTPAIDRIVDALARVDGVLGAQICGAGLGGAVLAWVRSAAVAAARNAARNAGARDVLAVRPSAAADLLAPDPPRSR